MEKIFFNNSKGKKICGNLDDTGSKTAVLICHGLGSHKAKYPVSALQKCVSALDLTTLSIDLLGHGESEGEYNDLTLTEAMDDILSAKKELERRGYSDIGFIGHSFGGVGGIMVAHSAEFKFLVLVSPPTHYDISEMISSGIYILWELHKFNKNEKDRKKARIKLKFFRDYGSHDSYVAAEKIKCPTLIIHGDADKIVPLEKSRELRKKISGAKLVIFKGGDHEYKLPAARGKLVEEVEKFVSAKS